MPGLALDSWIRVGIPSDRAAASTGTLTYPPTPATARARWRMRSRRASRKPAGSRARALIRSEGLLPMKPVAETSSSGKPASGTSVVSRPFSVPTKITGASLRRR